MFCTTCNPYICILIINVWLQANMTWIKDALHVRKHAAKERLRICANYPHKSITELDLELLEYTCSGTCWKNTTLCIINRLVVQLAHANLLKYPHASQYKHHVYINSTSARHAHMGCILAHYNVDICRSCRRMGYQQMQTRSHLKPQFKQNEAKPITIQCELNKRVDSQWFQEWSGALYRHTN